MTTLLKGLFLPTSSSPKPPLSQGQWELAHFLHLIVYLIVLKGLIVSVKIVRNLLQELCIWSSGVILAKVTVEVGVSDSFG